MLPLLQTLHNKGKQRSKINYIETKEGIWKIYQDMLNAKESFFITSYGRIAEHFPNSIEDWIRGYNSSKSKMHGKHLLVDDPKEIEIGKKLLDIDQEVRVIKNVKDLAMDFGIYGNKLAITSLGENPFLVLIESQNLVDSIKIIFDIAWRGGQEVKK